ncbi:MAG: PEP-CTERM sorting domain-containing protein [Phycisphaerae bacterium]|jgi:hypothetical protein
MKMHAAIAASFVLLVFASAHAGVIGFNPQEMTIDPSVDPLIFTTEMSVAAADVETAFENVDVIVGSDDLELMDFEFPFDVFCFDFSPCWAPDEGTYASGIKIGFFGSPQSVGLVLGTLTVDATGLPNGTYYILVDSNRDGGRSGLGATAEPLFGQAAVHIVPEPGTLALLVFSSALLLRGRRKGR